LTPVRDSDKMAENIKKLINNKELRDHLGEEAFKLRETHSVKNIIRQWDELLL